MNRDKLTNLFQIKSYIKNNTNLTIEINAEYSQLLQELFLTKKGKNNNRLLNLILLLHKPIPNKLTEEIFLLEKIEKIYLEELTEVAKDMKEILKI